MPNPSVVVRWSPDGLARVAVRRPGEVVVHTPSGGRAEIRQAGLRVSCLWCPAPGGTYDHLSYGTIGDPYCSW